MNNITPESLKKVAEHMGYVVRLSESCEPVTASGELCLKGTCIRYNPLQNSGQCLELMDKLLVSLSKSTSGGSWEVCCNSSNHYDKHYGKTISEAVTLAATNYVEAL